MSVYTSINQQQLVKFLAHYSLGALYDFSGIEAGIENTNYAVDTSEGHYILTIFETLSEQQLPCFLNLLNDLNKQQLPVPNPLFNLSNNYLTKLAGKPAVIFNRLPGHSIKSPSTLQCEEIGLYLAKIHLCGSQSSFNKPNLKNLSGCHSIFKRIKSSLSKDDVNLITSELDFQSTSNIPKLPQGIIHADLFKDNVLFKDNKVSGIVDFYNACHDYFLFDIAVTINDWSLENAAINHQNYNSFLSGYQQARKLTGEEQSHLPIFLRLAALRFWISRLEHRFHPKKGELTLEKDPIIFRDLLNEYRSQV